MLFLKSQYPHIAGDIKSVRAGEDLKPGQTVYLEYDASSGKEVAKKPTDATTAAKVTHIVGVVHNDFNGVGFVSEYNSGDNIPVMNNCEVMLDVDNFVAGDFAKSAYVGINNDGKLVHTSPVAATAKFFRVVDYVAKTSAGLLTVKMDKIL